MGAFIDEGQFFFTGDYDSFTVPTVEGSLWPDGKMRLIAGCQGAGGVPIVARLNDVDPGEVFTFLVGDAPTAHEGIDTYWTYNGGFPDGGNGRSIGVNYQPGLSPGEDEDFPDGVPNGFYAAGGGSTRLYRGGDRVIGSGGGSGGWRWATDGTPGYRNYNADDADAMRAAAIAQVGCPVGEVAPSMPLPGEDDPPRVPYPPDEPGTIEFPGVPGGEAEGGWSYDFYTDPDPPFGGNPYHFIMGGGGGWGGGASSTVYRKDSDDLITYTHPRTGGSNLAEGVEFFSVFGPFDAGPGAGVVWFQIQLPPPIARITVTDLGGGAYHLDGSASTGFGSQDDWTFTWMYSDPSSPPFTLEFWANGVETDFQVFGPDRSPATVWLFVEDASGQTDATLVELDFRSGGWGISRIRW